MDRRLGIKAVAEQYHVSARTLRYYEEIGILKSHRKDSRYREYDDLQLRRLETILLLRRLSFGIHDIVNLLLADGNGFRHALEAKIDVSNHLLVEFREVNQLLKRFYGELSKKPLPDLRAADILKEYTYLTQRTERTITMSLPHEERNRIAIGRGIIADIATGTENENAGNLVSKIGELRVEMAKQSITLPPIRVYDSGDLEKNQVLVILNGEEIWRKNYDDRNGFQCCDDIVNQIRYAFCQ